MNNKSYKKDKKNSKSAEKRHNYSKNQMNLLVYKNTQLPNNGQVKAEDSMVESPPFNKIVDRTKAKSCLGGYIDPNK
jgi:hypothetical protein